MKILMRFDGTYLIPGSEQDAEKYDKLQKGEYIVEVKKARNPAFHRKAFALINAMYENQERFDTMEDFRCELKIMTGSYKDYIRQSGEVVYIPKSWSFADMDEIEFGELYGKLLSIAAKRFGDEFADSFA